MPARSGCGFVPALSSPERDAVGVSKSEEPPNAPCVCGKQRQTVQSGTCWKALDERHKAGRRKACADCTRAGGKLSKMSRACPSRPGSNTRFQLISMPPLLISRLLRATTTTRASVGITARLLLALWQRWSNCTLTRKKFGQRYFLITRGVGSRPFPYHEKTPFQRPIGNRHIKYPLRRTKRALSDPSLLFPHSKSSVRPSLCVPFYHLPRTQVRLRPKGITERC